MELSSDDTALVVMVMWPGLFMKAKHNELNLIRQSPFILDKVSISSRINLIEVSDGFYHYLITSFCSQPVELKQTTNYLCDVNVKPRVVIGNNPRLKPLRLLLSIANTTWAILTLLFRHSRQCLLGGGRKSESACN